VALRPRDYDSALRKRVEGVGGVAALFDSEQRYISRSTAGDEVRGEEAPGELASGIRTNARGAGSFQLGDGQPVAMTWEPVPDTGWTVGVGIPAHLALGEMGRYLGLLALAAILLLAAAVAVATRLGRRITDAVGMIGDRAFQAAEGRADEIPRTNVMELDRLGEALARSATTIARSHQERQRLLEEETAAREEAERANRAKDELLAMLGHELRNPLAAITTSVHLLKRDRSAATLDFTHRVITRQSLHLARLVDDLLDVGRVITGKMRLRRMPVDLGEVVQSVVEALKASGDTAGRKVIVDIAEVHVSADLTRMHQVIMNLASNALKFADPEGTIHFSVRREAEEAVLAVRDTGRGMTPEELNRVFDVFYRGAVGELNSRGGLGLGLLVVRRIVEQHGGTVSAQSAGRGQGSVFTVRLPILRAPPMAGETATAGIDAGRTANPCTVLLIEDNEDMRQALKAALEQQGHAVAEAGDGHSGLDAAISMRPHVAIVDIGLPGMSGYQVAEAVREKAGQGMYLIALTGHGQPEDIRRASHAGFDMHVVKPPDMRRLLRMLDNLTRQSRSA
jgi:signal transduction histidine kinase/ActR/RegA family two-component response regulator